MRPHSSSIGVLAIACGLLAGATPALAAAETWVSGTGTDGGTCPITAPCRTFAHAHSQTNVNGAINVLTSGSFGPLTISKPISIVADGVEAVINTGAGGVAISVTAGAGAVVSLRGLTIDLRGTANSGIQFNTGAALHIQGCVIRKTLYGIAFNPSAGAPELYVTDTLVTESGQSNILVTPVASGSAKVVLDRVRLENAVDNGINFDSSSASNSITATVRDTVSAGNGSGIRAIVSNGGSAKVIIDRAAVVNNTGNGVTSIGAGAIIRIGDSTVTGNNAGLVTANSGVIDSYGTNKVDGNSLDGTPTNTILTK